MHPLTPQCLPVDNNITSDYANVARLLTPHCLKFCLNYSKVSQTLGCLLAITQHQCCVTANGQDLGLLRTSGYFSIWGRSRLSAWSASISPIPRKKINMVKGGGGRKGKVYTFCGFVRSTYFWGGRRKGRVFSMILFCGFRMDDHFWLWLACKCVEGVNTVFMVAHRLSFIPSRNGELQWNCLLAHGTKVIP